MENVLLKIRMQQPDQSEKITKEKSAQKNIRNEVLEVTRQTNYQ